MTGPEQESAEVEQRERYQELLAELRVVLPGVQVLFAFLLTAPFSARFAELDDLGRHGFAVAIITAAISTVFFLTPTSYHRVGRREDREHRLRTAILLSIAGMAALSISMVSALFVVTRFIYGTAGAWGVAAAVLAAILVLWYLLPLARRLRDYR